MNSRIRPDFGNNGSKLDLNNIDAIDLSIWHDIMVCYSIQFCGREVIGICYRIIVFQKDAF